MYCKAVLLRLLKLIDCAVGNYSSKLIVIGIQTANKQEHLNIQVLRHIISSFSYPCEAT